MRRNLLLLKTLAVFLILAIGLPAAVHPEPVEGYALRQSGLEENAAKDDFLKAIGSSTPTTRLEETRSDESILEAIKRLKARTPPVAITQSAIAAEAGVVERTVTNRKQTNPTVAAAIEAAVLTDADARILSAIEWLKARTPPVAISKSAIAAEAGVAKGTVTNRKQANPAVAAAIEAAVPDVDTLILSAIERLKARTPPVAITRLAIAAEAGVSKNTVTTRKQANSAVAAAIEAVKQSFSGLEESWMQDFLDILEEAAPQGPGVLVIEVAEISRRMGLAEFVARVPRRLGDRIVLF